MLKNIVAIFQVIVSIVKQRQSWRLINQKDFLNLKYYPMKKIQEGKRLSIQFLDSLFKECDGKIERLKFGIKFQTPEELMKFQSYYDEEIQGDIDLQESQDDQRESESPKKRNTKEQLQTFEEKISIANSVILKTHFQKQIEQIGRTYNTKILVVPQKIKFKSEDQSNLQDAVQQLSKLTKNIKCHSLRQKHNRQEVYYSEYYKKKLQPIQMIKILGQYYLWYLSSQVQQAIIRVKHDQIFERTYHRFYQLSINRAGNFQIYYQQKENIGALDCKINPTRHKFNFYCRQPKEKGCIPLINYALLQLKGKMFQKYFEKEINVLGNQKKTVELSLDKSAVIIHCDVQEQFILAEYDLEKKYKKYYYCVLTIKQTQESDENIHPILEKIIKQNDCEKMVCYGQKNYLWIALLQEYVQQAKQILCKIFIKLGQASIGVFKNQVELVPYQNPKFTVKFIDKWLCNFILKSRNQQNYQILYEKIFVSVIKQKRVIRQEQNKHPEVETQYSQNNTVDITQMIDQSTTFVNADQSSLNASNFVQQQAILISMNKQSNLAGRLATYDIFIEDTEGKNKYKDVPSLKKVIGKPQKAFQENIEKLTMGNKYKACNVEIPEKYKILIHIPEKEKVLDKVVTVFIPETEKQLIYSETPVKAYLLSSYQKISRNGYLANIQLQLLREIPNKQSFQLEPKSYEIIKFLKYLQ